MPQFVNPYNSQNGMNLQPNRMVNSSTQPMFGYSQPAYDYGGGNYMSGNMGSGQLAQPQSQPNTQGWKTYSDPSQQQVQIQPIFGRWVNGFEEIKPQEVQMDGNWYIFPQEDRSCIYVRFWNNNGQLMTFRFLPEKVDTPVDQQSSISPEMNDILKGYEAISTNVSDRLASLEEKTAHIYDLITGKEAVT